MDGSEILEAPQTEGAMREYVKEFSSFVLDIKNLSNDDKIFNFMSGLQGWVHTELQRNGVRDLPVAKVVVDYLVDYKMGGTISTTQKAKPEGAKKAKYEAKTSKKSRWKKQKGKDVTVTKQSEKNGKAVQPSTQPSGCFIFNGLHRARDCPKREKLTVLVSGEDKEDSDFDGPSRVTPL